MIIVRKMSHSDFTEVTYLESGAVSYDAIYMNCPEKANLCRKESRLVVSWQWN